MLNKLFKGSKAWIGRQSNRVKTLLRRTLGETRGRILKSGHGNTKGKQSCLKRRIKEHKGRKRRGIRCEKRKTVVQITEVEEKCRQKEMQRFRKNRKIKITTIKEDSGGSKIRNVSRKVTKRSKSTKGKVGDQKQKTKRCGKQKRQKCLRKGGTMKRGRGRSGGRHEKTPGQQKRTGHRKGKRKNNVKSKRSRRRRGRFMGPVRNAFNWASQFLGSRDQSRQQRWQQSWQQPWQPNGQQHWQPFWQQSSKWHQTWQPNGQKPWHTTSKYQPTTSALQTLAPMAPALGPQNVLPTPKPQGLEGGGGSSDGFDLNKAQ